MPKYKKPALTVELQLQQLKNRGMVIPDDAVARQWLTTVSYYRLSAYFYPYKQADESFKQGTSFETVQMLYEFDRFLRLLLLGAIERVEVALRTAVTYQLAMKLGPFAHCHPDAFRPQFRHRDFMSELDSAEKYSHETFVRHFRQKYAEERNLPIWMATELLSFGTISLLVEFLRGDVLKQVARTFKTTETFLPSWMHSLSYVRNLCAHHARLCNRTLTVKPKLPSPQPWFPFNIPRNDSVYCILVLMHHVLKAIHPTTDWSFQVKSLFDNFPAVPLASAGMPEHWRDSAPWN
jgi:abortive infection bacteriophage resistance protein